MSDNRTRSMTIASALIVVLALVGFVMGAGALRQRIKPSAGPASQFKTLDEQEAARMLALRKEDTDRDGLSDYDELFLYRTSPYLEDTDSDSFSDKIEVETGNDPNCPRGKVCGAEVEIRATATTTLPVPESQGLVAPDLFSLLGKSPQEIRAALKDAGVASELLDKIDDKTLLEMYRQALSESITTSTAR